MAIRFRDWQRLCDRVARESSRLAKSNAIREWVSFHWDNIFPDSSPPRFYVDEADFVCIVESGECGSLATVRKTRRNVLTHHPDPHQFLLELTPLQSHKPGRWESAELKKAFKFLIPKYDHRTYQLQDKQLIKILARVYRADASEMESDMHGDTGVIADTAEKFFPDTNPHPIPLTLGDIDDLLTQFSKTGTESSQEQIFLGLAKVCTARDMNYVVRLLKKDLRIQGQDRTVLDGLHEDAYEAFKRQKDVEALVEKVVRNSQHAGASAASGAPAVSRRLSGAVKMGAPIEPMLAKQLKDLKEPFGPGFKTGKEMWNGVAAEIKYDGERVQVHMNGDKFSYFSRSLKESQPKVTSEIKDHVPKAFAPDVANCILDAEVLLVDRSKSGHAAMLPFGSLGVHKKTKFASANVCLFVFDILWLNGESLLDKSLRERRRILEKTIVQIPYRVILSEFKWLKDADEAKEMMQIVVEHGLEGLMLKNAQGKYNPKGRHWLKVKRNYLSDAAGKTMVDSVDLVVLGGYHGAGKKAGLLSSFLMGCQDSRSGQWKTVTKCANGFDDDQLATINKKLKPLLQPCGSAGKVPSWLDVDQSLIPPFVVDPGVAPVWEIGGAEFTESERHTASRISIRFPVVIKERDDKDAAHANTLDDVKHIRDVSLARSSVNGNGNGAGSAGAASAAPSYKRPATDDDEAPASKRDRPAVSSPTVVCVDDDDDDDDWAMASSKASTAAPSASTSTSSADTTRAPPKVALDTRDYCRYGIQCYRKNPDHIRKFRHGDDRDKQFQ